MRSRLPYTLARPGLALYSISFALAIGLGCGGSGGLGGCGGGGAIPPTPGTPYGMPLDQQIEGGMQVRITKPGFDKLSSLIPVLATGLLPTAANPTCVPEGQQALNVAIFEGDFKYCDRGCGNGGQGCPVYMSLRPDLAPPKGISISVPDNPNKAVINLDIAFDVHVEIPIETRACINLFGHHCTGWGSVCGNLTISSSGTHILAGILLDIDPSTGKLTIALDHAQLAALNLNQPSGCGAVGDFVIGLVFDIVNAFASSFIGDFVINNLLKPQLTKLLAGFLPDPPGLATLISTGKTLASYDAPPDAALETLLIAGGYVQALGGGLNLGVITGMNSDRDPTTRDPGLTSEASLCVPQRPAPDLSGVPWNLPVNPARPDHNLDSAAEFKGSPEPTDPVTGNIDDIAMGISRSFLDLAGYHVYNSGTLCLSISGGVLSAFNAGAISVLVPSLSNILENRKAPVAVSLRPQQPLVFTIGAGSAMDPLLRIQVTDLRVDFYVFLEERYVRLFTLALDLSVGLNLTVTPDPVTGNPTIAPMITGIDKASLQARVSNTDLLQENPDNLAKALLGLIDVAVSQATGGIKPIALPSLMGFTLDGLTIGRVQSQQDDFLAIFGAIKQDSTMMPYPVPASAVEYRRVPRGIQTNARIVDVNVPPPDVIHDAVMNGDVKGANVPTVTVELGGSGRQMEWSWRVDGGSWSNWTAEPRPTISDAHFLLQARHTIDVKARDAGDWVTEDQSPQRLEVTIDSVPPVLQLAVGKTGVVFHATDNVSDDKAIRYAWLAAGGWTEPSLRASLSIEEAWAASQQGTRSLRVVAYDEMGNQIEQTLADLGGLEAFHGRTTAAASSGGCGCTVGGHDRGGSRGTTLLAVIPLLGLLFRRSLRQPSARTRKAIRLGGVVAVVAVASQLGACNCGPAVRKSGCSVDDDCRATMCDPGNIPQCMAGGMCGCTSDLNVGDIGRFSTMVMRGETAYISAYNATYGDLMLGHITPPGVVTNWDYVDGIPDDGVIQNPLSQVRGGIADPGVDVGRYTSVALDGNQNPVIAYYDVSHNALKYAHFGAVRWHTHLVDGGGGNGGEVTNKDDIGRYASLTVGPDGLPGIAYYAEVDMGMSGMRESQLRYAKAKVAEPESASDWQIFTIKTSVMPTIDPANPPPLPEGIALFISSARKPDGSPTIAFYDRTRGNLCYVDMEGGVNGNFGEVKILDGEDPMGGDTADVGQYPSIIVESDGTAHISYVDATHDNLLYVNTRDLTPEVADDGYRPMDETTLDGLPSPVYHLVGDNSSIQIAQDSRIIIGYGDSTAEQLRVATRDPLTTLWASETVAGHAAPFDGAYGFYAQARVNGGTLVLSSYAINQHLDSPSFYVQTFGVELGTIQ